MEYRGITVDRAPGGWQQPASPLAAGLLNVLPGGGNFYLASGNAADSSHWVYGMVNLLFWPISILWGVPEATIDAGNINKREMLNFYKYGNGGIPDFPGLEAGSVPHAGDSAAAGPIPQPVSSGAARVLQQLPDIRILKHARIWADEDAPAGIKKAGVLLRQPDKKKLIRSN